MMCFGATCVLEARAGKKLETSYVGFDGGKTAVLRQLYNMVSDFRPHHSEGDDLYTLLI